MENRKGHRGDKGRSVQRIEVGHCFHQLIALAISDRGRCHIRELEEVHSDSQHSAIDLASAVHVLHSSQQHVTEQAV